MKDTATSTSEGIRISQRSFYRYQDMIFSEERDFLNHTVSQEEMRRQIILCRDRMLADIMEINEWLKANPEAKDRADLANLRAELSAAVLRIYQGGPSMIAAKSGLPDDYNHNLSLEEIDKEEREPVVPFYYNNKKDEEEAEEAELYSEQEKRQQDFDDTNE